VQFYDLIFFLENYKTEDGLDIINLDQPQNLSVNWLRTYSFTIRGMQ